MTTRNASSLCHWEPEPSYLELARDLVQFFKEANNVTGQIPIKWSNQFRADEMAWYGLATLLFLVIRILAKKYIFWRLVKNSELSVKKKILFCENLWNFVSTIIMWSFSFHYVVVEMRFFQCPSKIWDDWSLQTNIPSTVFPAMVVGAGFFLQCTVSVIFLEEKRKDTTSAIVHHGITTLLFLLSSTLRYHHLAALATVILNFTSLPMYVMHMLLQFKDQAGKYSRLRAQATNFVLLLFTLTWVLFRLYWYPLRCIYAIGPMAMKNKLLSELPYIWQTVLLFCLYYILNVYWFIMLLSTVYKFATKSKNLKKTVETKMKMK